MSWDSHTEHVANKAARALGLLYRHRDSLPIKTRLLIYNSLFISYIEYCFLVWGTTISTNILKLKRIQNKIIRVIANTAPDHSAEPLLKKYGLISIDNLYNFKLSLALRNEIKKHTHSLRTLAKLKVNARSYNTRHLEYWDVPLSRTNYGEDRLCCLIPRMLNNFYAQNIHIEHFTFDQLKQYYI